MLTEEDFEKIKEHEFRMLARQMIKDQKWAWFMFVGSIVIVFTTAIIGLIVFIVSAGYL